MKKFLLISLLKNLMNSKTNYRRAYSANASVRDRAGHDFFYERKRPMKIFRFAKFAIVAALLLTLTASGLAIWGVVSAVNYAGSFIKEQPLAERTTGGTDWEVEEKVLRPAEERLIQGKAMVADLLSQPITTQACLDRVQNALNPGNWLTVPIATHWKNVRDACAGNS